MTTSTPTLALHIAAWAASQGVLALDAPVSGGDVGAEAQHPYRHPRMLRWGPPALWILPRGWIRSSWTLKKGMSSLPGLLHGWASLNPLKLAAARKITKSNPGQAKNNLKLTGWQPAPEKPTGYARSWVFVRAVLFGAVG